MVSPHPRVYYLDDERAFLNKFMERHAQHYDIRPFSSIGDLFAALRLPDDLPDLILLDLFHEKADATAEQRAAANAALETLDTDLDRIARAVYAARTPLGAEVFIELRTRPDLSEELKEVPVLMYTRRGILLLPDQDLRRLAGHRAEWMLKNPLQGEDQVSPETERIWIDRVIEDSRAIAQLKRRKAIHIEPDTLTIGQLIGALKPQQLWGMIAAIVTALVGIATAAYQLGARLGSNP